MGVLWWLNFTVKFLNPLKDIFKRTYSEVNPGQVLDDLEAEQAVQRVLDTADLPKGMSPLGP